MRLIEEDGGLVEAVGPKHGFEHWQAMAVASQFAGHLQHRFKTLVSTHFTDVGRPNAQCELSGWTVPAKERRTKREQLSGGSDAVLPHEIGSLGRFGCPEA